METEDDGKLKFYCCLFPDLLCVYFIKWQLRNFTISWFLPQLPKKIITVETEIPGMSFFKFLSALHSAVGHSTDIRNGHPSDKISTCRG